jgi:hypothetical protein
MAIVLKDDGVFDPLNILGGSILPGKRTILSEWHLGQIKFFIEGITLSKVLDIRLLDKLPLS